MSKSIKDKVKGIIESQLMKLHSFQEPYSDHIPQWKDRTIRMLTGIVIDDELELFAAIEKDTWELEFVAYEKMLNEIKQGVFDNPEIFLFKQQLKTPEIVTKRSISKDTKDISNKIFVVHGHDSLAKTEVARMLEKLGLEAIILHEQPNEGKTVIEKFERDASQVSFAVILMTPDDIGYPKNKEKDAKARARQNVFLELGYFSGVLGRSNVCVLYKGDVEIPSDYLGVVYVPFDKDGAWRFNLGRELKKAGLSIDLNQLV